MDAAYGQTPESQQNMIEQVAAAIVKEAQAGRGDYPADIVRWAEATIKPAKVKWHQLLAKIIRGRMANRAGGGGVSYARPARRMAGLGYGNGRPVLPANRSVTPEVQAWVDTSGSVGSEELAAALAEIETIMRTLPGRVTVGACDAKVHALKKVSRFSEVMPLLKGGGGTNFIPLFKAAMEVKDKPDVIIVLTDGMATIPDEPPNDVDVIWVLIGRYKVSTMPWGRCVVVDEEA
jgi:predicted metal-dependent peptidase